MRILLVVGAAIAALAFASSANAADMPVKARPVPVVAAPYNWTGIYVGGTIGGVWGDWSYTDLLGSSATNRVSGILGGPTLGFNWQTGAVVLGVEGDWSWSNAKGSDTSGCSPNACVNHYPWFATARGRLGYAFDRWLPYLTGGGVFSRNEITSGGADLGSKNITGWTIGGGLEWAFWQNWSAKVEYLHLDFGDQSIFAPAIAQTIVHHDKNLNIVRLGLNYRFNWLR